MSRLAPVITLILICSNLFGNDLNGLNPTMEKIINHSALKGAIVGISVKDQSNQDVFNHNENHLMIPGSTLKVITTFVTMDLLGPEFKYNTQVYYDGLIDRSGTLSGNIWILGSGDPSLGSSREEIGRDMQVVLNEILIAIKNKGISCIDGKIILQNNRFDQEMAHPSWPWSDVGNYYGGGVSGFNINENEYFLHYNTNGNIGEKAELIEIFPAIVSMKINSEVTIDRKDSGDNAYIYGGPGNYEKVVRGTLPQGHAKYTIKGSLPDPSTFFLPYLSSFLESNGISHSGYSINQVQKLTSKNILKEFRSKELSMLSKLANANSINLYCESFLKTIDKKGTREAGIQQINRKLSEYKIDTLSIQMEDGSGLSPRNMVTPSFFTSFLYHYKKKWGIDFCTKLLPQISKEGTVRGMLRNSPAEGKAYIKSGYIGKVLCYTGYVLTNSGKWYSMALMFNQYRCKTSEVRFLAEKIIEEIYLSS
jgi:D-alanyl-D-alanine carboxypeptidase/D-alanyl-D-alanine-endopeptidase (penicillin-binding protein 4)